MGLTFEDEENRGFFLQAALLDADGNVFVVIGVGAELTRASRLYFGARPHTARDLHLSYVPTHYGESSRRRHALPTERTLTPHRNPNELPLRREAMGDDHTAALLQRRNEGVASYAWRPHVGAHALGVERLYLLADRVPRHDWADAHLVLGHNVDSLEVRPRPNSVS